MTKYSFFSNLLLKHVGYLSFKPNIQCKGHLVKKGPISDSNTQLAFIDTCPHGK